MQREFLLSLKRNPLGRSIYLGAKKIYESWHRIRPATADHLRSVISIEGKVTPAECDMLYRLASQVSTGSIVDIGCYRGRSTAALALGSMAGESLPVYAIDPHEPFEGIQGGRFGPQDRVAFFRNMLRLGLGETVHLINVRADLVSRVWSSPVGLVWIDGDHRYEAVKMDFESWKPFVLEGGLIGLHDSTDVHRGPGRIVAAAVSSGRFEEVGKVDMTTILQKV